MSGVPAADQTLAVLSHLAAQPGPVPAASIARDLGLPRSTTYHLLAAMGRAGFVVHLPEERRYGLGVSAFELGTAYTRQAPLARLARPVLARLVDAVGHNAHLAVLHGREVLYVVEERAPGRPPLVTDVGVRLPAPLTASGRAVLAALPAAQVRALFPDASVFVERHGTGPRSLTALRTLLQDTRRAGVAREDGEVTPGFASMAVAVLDHTDHPVAGLAVTWPTDDPPPPALADRLRRAADELLPPGRADAVTTLAEAVASRPVVLDGGLATHLESRGADLSGGLWSARMLLDPAGRRRLVQAHADFLAAGAEVLTTASYQLGARSLEGAGLDPATAGDLAARSVQVAREAAAALGEARTAWVAGSVGAYGALLADGSEYTGDYGLGDEAATVGALVEAHAPRVEALLVAGADVVSVETVPRAAEVEAVAHVLARSGAPAWVSLTVAPGGTTTRRGEPLADAVAPLAGLTSLVAVGVNCVRPQDVAPALAVLSVLETPLVVYPNSGETWDAARQRWIGRGRWDDAAVPAWLDAGARLVGGCCRVGPDQVRTVVSTLSGEPHPERT